MLGRAARSPTGEDLVVVTCMIWPVRISVGVVVVLVAVAGLTGCEERVRSHSAASHTPTPAPTALRPAQDPAAAPPRGLPDVACAENKDGSRDSYLPVEITIACADNGMRATRLSWKGWTAKRALARGGVRAERLPADLPRRASHRVPRRPIRATRVSQQRQQLQRDRGDVRARPERARRATTTDPLLVARWMSGDAAVP
jgi:hypothetical protein